MREAPVTVKLCWEPPPSNCHDGVLPPSQYEIWGKGQGRGKFPIQEDCQRRSPSMAPVRAAAIACAILRYFHTGRAETGLEGSFSRWNVFGDARTLSSLRRKHSTIAGASAMERHCSSERCHTSSATTPSSGRRFSRRQPRCPSRIGTFPNQATSCLGSRQNRQRLAATSRELPPM